MQTKIQKPIQGSSISRNSAASQIHSRPATEEQDLFSMNGWFFLLLTLGLGFFVATSFISSLTSHNGGLTFMTSVMGGLLFFLMKGLTIINPNEAIVATFFGTYAGTKTDSGFHFINPLLSCDRIPVKSNNYITPVLKVNDGSGNPVEIAAAIVWHIESPAAAVFDVQNIESYVKSQSEGALRDLAGHHPYDSHESNGICLRRQSDEILNELRENIQNRLYRAGIKVEEARITHLAYAPEIAQAMLKKQQAQAIIAAREAIVQGAIEMVANAVQDLSNRGIVEMDSKDKAHLVTNMLTVLLSDEGTTPVVNVNG